MDHRNPRRFGRVLSIALAAATGLTPMATISLGSAVAAASTSVPSASRTSSATAAMPSTPTQTSVESQILTMLNADRVAHGLRPFRVDSRLRTIARQRTSTMATLNNLSHTIAGNLGNELTAAGVHWYGWGEDIGWTTYPWGAAAANSLYTMWKASPEHWTLMMSSTYDYVGIGIGYRPANAGTFGSIVFTESPDRTAPIVKMLSVARAGRTIVFTWRGADVLLQTHTAGFRSFDVEYHRDDRTWSVIRKGITSTHLTLTHRVRGHTYYVRIRGRDRAGNVSGWSGTLRIRVP